MQQIQWKQCVMKWARDINGSEKKRKDKKNITVKNTDIKAYHTYEEIMVDTLKKKIEEDKVIANKKAREKAKAEKEKKKKVKSD